MLNITLRNSIILYGYVTVSDYAESESMTKWQQVKNNEKKQYKVPSKQLKFYNHNKSFPAGSTIVIKHNWKPQFKSCATVAFFLCQQQSDGVNKKVYCYIQNSQSSLAAKFFCSQFRQLSGCMEGAQVKTTTHWQLRECFYSYWLANSGYAQIRARAGFGCAHILLICKYILYT